MDKLMNFNDREVAIAATICRMFNDKDHRTERAGLLFEHYSSGLSATSREIAFMVTVCQLLEENADNLGRARTLFQKLLESEV